MNRRPARTATYPDEVGEFGGTSSGRVRPQGNIETLRSGSLRVRVYAGTDVVTGRDLYLRALVKPGPRQAERAEKTRQDLLRQVDEGRHERTSAPVRHLVESHLAVAQVEPRTLRSLTGYARKHVYPLIGDRPMGSLPAQVLDSFYAELRRCRDHCDGSGVQHRTTDEHACDRRCRRHRCRGLGPATIRKIHSLLNCAYTNAIRWEWLTINPMVRARPPAPPAPNPAPPSPEDAVALLTECWRRGIGPYVWVAMTTGARRGELCALRWRDLHVRHNTGDEHDCVPAGCTAKLLIARTA